MKKMFMGDDWFVPFTEGDDDAFEWMLGLFRPDLLVYAVRRLNNDSMAEDIVQGVFVKVFLNPGQFVSIPHLRHFLYGVTNRDCISYERWLDCTRKVIKRQDCSTTANTEGIDYKKLLEKMGEEMYRTIPFLDEDHRTILEMVIAGKKTVEIAAALKITPPTVRARKSRAIQAIKDLLAGSGLLFLFFIPRMLFPVTLPLVARTIHAAGSVMLISK